MQDNVRNPKLQSGRIKDQEQARCQLCGIPLSSGEGCHMAASPETKPPDSQDFIRVQSLKRFPEAKPPAYVQGRLDQFIRMKKERPIDPIYWDSHEERALRDAAASPEAKPEPPQETMSAEPVAEL